ncbi:Hypothetical protein FKW44_025258 [Caligus rogercresseyi]|uniref:Uncharacterized protein n=1 Tax=Caligus rogercresseyi TaxID=217165 RepID=A0A7T8JSE4_CALRO|nr:Hypothetical protein FKW44_025258 [Caligus rogercresseyi]
MDIFIELEGRKVQRGVSARRKMKLQMHLIYDCSRTRFGMDELAFETKERGRKCWRDFF